MKGHSELCGGIRNGESAEWVRSAVSLLSPPCWLEGQHHYQRARACKTVSHPGNVSTESRKGFANSGRGSLFLIVVQGWKLRGRCLPATTPNAPGRRHCSESERRYPAKMRLLCVVFGGHAELQPTRGEDNVHRLAATFSHIWWRTVSVPNLYLHSINIRRGAPPDV